ncbi:MAG: leucine-rich repeat protein [Oscillospiraceae bacterium]|nr:leucine-rich repeat protein [Oscillospiraceae bacterium]
MKTGLKKLIAMVICTVLAVSMLTGGAMAFIAVQGTCGDCLTWTLTDDGVMTVSGTGDMRNDPWPVYKNDIKTVVINDGATSIGKIALEECKLLTSVTIADSVTKIDDWALDSCTSLRGITLPERLKTIGKGAFYGCTLFKDITIPKNVTSIGSFAFGDCPALTEINVDAGNPAFSSDSGVLYNRNRTKLIQVPGGFKGDYTIPDSVTVIGEGALIGCKSLTGIAIPEGVTEIGDWAFESCESLKEITVPESVTSIGSYAFNGCASIKSITIPEGVTEIGFTVFAGCTSLEKVVFKGNAPSFTNDFFENVNATVYYPANNRTWDKYVKANNQLGGSITWVASGEERVRGDVDGDGKVGNSDLILVARYVVAIYTEATKADVERYGDMNGDGVITNQDIISVARKVVGLG